MVIISSLCLQTLTVVSTIVLQLEAHRPLIRMGLWNRDEGLLYTCFIQSLQCNCKSLIWFISIKTPTARSMCVSV